MTGPFIARLEAQHRQLTQALSRSMKGGGIDLARFEVFRLLLLRCIAEQERFFLPALVHRRAISQTQRRAMHRDHEDLIALCAPVPQADWLEGLGELLEFHLAVESSAGGFAALCDEHLWSSAEALFARADALPEFALPALVEGPRVRPAIVAMLLMVGVSP